MRWFIFDIIVSTDSRFSITYILAYTCSNLFFCAILLFWEQRWYFWQKTWFLNILKCSCTSAEWTSLNLWRPWRWTLLFLNFDFPLLEFLIFVVRLFQVLALRHLSPFQVNVCNIYYKSLQRMVLCRLSILNSGNFII